MRFRVSRALGISLLFTGLSFSQTFSSQNVATVSSVKKIVTADFNGDGNLDMVATTGVGVVLLGDGHGGFTRGTDIPQINMGLDDVAVGDFNGDGIPDLIVSDPFDPTVTGVYALRGNGDGTFQQPKMITAVDQYHAVALADFNGDKKLDLAVVSGRSASFKLGDGHGNFTDGPAIADIDSFIKGEAEVTQVAAFDEDSDGNTDLLINVCCSSNQFKDHFALLHNDGDGTFLPSVLDAFTAVKGFSVADMNRDGSKDLFVNSQCTGCSGLDLIFSAASLGTSIAAHFNDPVLRAPLVADLDNDGYDDFVYQTKSGSNNAIGIIRQNTDGSFATHKLFPLTTAAQSVNSPVIGDFDNDGRMDIAYAEPAGNHIVLLHNATATAQGCAATGLRTMHLCTPPDGSSVGSPVHILATPQTGSPITGIRIYVDSVSQFLDTDSSRVSTRLRLPAGTHRLTVKAWDVNGPFSVTSNVHVSPGSACKTSGDRTVLICAPIAGQMNSSSVRVIADLQTMFGLKTAQVYIDGQLLYSTPIGRFYVDRTFTGLAPGNHALTVKGWDAGGEFSARTTFVVAGP